MLGPYGAALRAPGAAAFSVAGLVGRFPLSMLGIGIVVLVESSTGSYALAGGLAAVYVVATSAGAPVQARLADRLGQARVLVPTCTVHAVSLGALLVLSAAGQPSWTLASAAVVIGVSMPQVGSMVRARWSALPAGSVRLHTAYSLEAVNDEIVFVVGPVLVTTLATLVDPSAGLALAALLTLTGGLALAAQRRTQPAVARARDAAPRERLPLATIGPLVLSFVCLGALFGAMEVSTVGFADEQGSPALAGPLLAVFSSGSLVAGLVYGTLRLRSDPDRRYLLGVAVLTTALLPLPFVGSPWLLAVVVLAAGAAISPTLVTGNLLLTEHVPGNRLTEALAWTGTGLGAGVALGSSVAGAVIDAVGASPAYGVAVVSGAVGTLIAAARLPAARRARARVRA